MEVRSKKIDEGEFLQQRKEVLAQWPTGKDVDLDEAVAYQKSIPPSKNHTLKLLEAKQKGLTLVHSNMGFTTLKQNKDLLLSLQNDGRSQFLRSIQDSMTRTLRYAEAENIVRESEKTNRNLLNGFPVAIYGVRACRELTEIVDMPMTVKGPTIDSRLTAEIGLAAGYTDVESGGDCNAFINYSKTTSYETAMRMQLYGCCLKSYYQNRGVPLVQYVQGPLNVTGATPPSLGTAYVISTLFIHAVQGIKYICTGTKSQGNLIQDIASNVCRMELCREYLDKWGYTDVELLLENGNLDGPYPKSHAEAIAIILHSALLSALTKAQSCWIKTLDEADAIPTKDNQIFSLRACQMMVNMIGASKIDLINSKQVRDEVEQEKREARAIIDRIFDFGDGDPIIGAKKAFETGVLDWPLPNNRNVMGKVMGIKDAEGAVRYLDFGNLPFDEEIKSFHRAKVAEREILMNRKITYDTVVSDVLALSKGSLLSDTRWPLPD